MDPILLNAILPVAGVLLTVVLNRLGIRLPMQPSPVVPGPLTPISPAPVTPVNPSPVAPSNEAFRLIVREEVEAAIRRLLGSYLPK